MAHTGAKGLLEILLLARSADVLKFKSLRGKHECVGRRSAPLGRPTGDQRHPSVQPSVSQRNLPSQPAVNVLGELLLLGFSPRVVGLRTLSVGLNSTQHHFTLRQKTLASLGLPSQLRPSRPRLPLFLPSPAPRPRALRETRPAALSSHYNNQRRW